MGFRDDVEKEKSSSDFYKFVKGDQKFRIMSEPALMKTRFGDKYGICFDGAPYCDPSVMQKEYEEKVEQAKKDGKDPAKVSKPSLTSKYMCWAVLRGKTPEQDRMVIVKIPKQLAEKLLTWMDSEEYGFKEFPMPYDVIINADENVGTTKVKYEMMASRKETPVLESEIEELSKKTPCDQIIDKMKAKRKAEFEGLEVAGDAPVDYPEEEVNAEDIPF